MCELVEVALEMVTEMGANVSIKNKEGLTAAEAIREEGDFDDLADYLESVTPDIVPRNVDTSALAYTEFREDEDDDDEEEGEENIEGIVPGDQGSRIDEILRLEQADGANRDEELRGIVTEAIMRQMGRGEGGRGSSNSRQRRDNNE
jgi:hypothetical protein